MIGRMGATRVVIIGAGFAGLSCARRLAGREVHVILMDRNNYHLFTPLLYQVASSLLDPSEIAKPVRSLFRGCENVSFLMAEATGADLSRRVVLTAEGMEVPYDRLVLAAGSETHFFGLPEPEKWACGLKDLPEALELRNKVIQRFEAASSESDESERRSLLTFVVVGGGPTGVEYAGALSELVRRVLSQEYLQVDMREVRILLVEAGPRILGPFPESLSAEAARTLEKLGVEVRAGARVEHAGPESVRLAGGEEFRTRTIVWAAGVRPAGLARALDLPRTRSGRLKVDERLRVEGQERVYAVGDMAAVLQGGEELPMFAPAAMQEARYVADSILGSLDGRESGPFRYVDRGTMATVGRNQAVAVVGRLKFGGFIGWVAWLVLHLYFIIGFRNRLFVLLQWAWYYFFYDRPVRIIMRARG